MHIASAMENSGRRFHSISPPFDPGSSRHGVAVLMIAPVLIMAGDIVAVTISNEYDDQDALGHRSRHIPVKSGSL